MSNKEFRVLEKKAKLKAKELRIILDKLFAADNVFGEEVDWDVHKILDD